MNTNKGESSRKKSAEEVQCWMALSKIIADKVDFAVGHRVSWSFINELSNSGIFKDNIDFSRPNTKSQGFSIVFDTASEASSWHSLHMHFCGGCLTKFADASISGAGIWYSFDFFNRKSLIFCSWRELYGRSFKFSEICWMNATF